MKGGLFIIGTPIGNLSDISKRALETLSSLDLLYCEDTRTTSKLLQHFSIDIPTRALSDDHGQGRWQEAVQKAVEGRRVGYVSEAGMPGISDPARRLASAAWQAGIAPVVIPGPSAVAALLAACPFVEYGFCFAGFVPRKLGERQGFIASLVSSTEPVVCFEAPLRIHALLDDLCKVLEGSRQILVGREMTKLYEQLLLLTAADWPGQRSNLPARGEFTIAVAGSTTVKPTPEQAVVAAALGRLDSRGFSPRDAVVAVAAVLDVGVNDIKRLAYTQPGESGDNKPEC